MVRREAERREAERAQEFRLAAERAEVERAEAARREFERIEAARADAERLAAVTTAVTGNTTVTTEPVAIPWTRFLERQTWPSLYWVERIERTVQPTEAQRAALKELQDATTAAVNLLKSDCPTYRALTPVGRLEAMEQRLDAMLRAVQTVRPALELFYSQLSNEQKERFNRLSPAQG